MSIELPIIVERITYQKDNFCILAANLDPYSSRYNPNMELLVKDAISSKYKTFTIKVSNITSPLDNIEGGQYIFVGNFENDPKRGIQFKSEYYYLDTPNTEEGLKNFLMTLPNIKEMRSKAIIDKFGVEGTIDVLDNNPSRLREINGINEKRIAPIKKEWDEKRYLCKFYEWLSKNKVSVGIADKAYKLWGTKSMDILQNNPYKLVDLRGIGFITADKLAYKILSDVPSHFRMRACIQYILEQQLNESNLCLPYPSLKKNVLNIISECDGNLKLDGIQTVVEDYSQLISKTLKENLDIFSVVKDVDETPAVIYVYLRKIWDQEKYISGSLLDRYNLRLNQICNDLDINDAENNICQFYGKKIILDETQKEAVKSAFNNSVTVITGGAGTGKSMISRCIVYLAQKKRMSVRLMSPTGKAAQVLSEKTGMEASTIHRSLKMKPGDAFPNERIVEDIVIIDEISMCGIDTIYALMVAVESTTKCRIVLIGDKNQLPSVSPGNFLTDIISSQCANVVTLDKIHRQDENSYISIVANDISKGKVANIPVSAIDIKWHDINADNFHTDIVKFVDNYLNEGKNIDDLQFISPMKKGVCGVFAINQLLQTKMSEIHHTNEIYISVGFNKFYLSDRVIQIENNYEKDVYNGDMGKIVDLGEKVFDPLSSDRKVKYITVDFNGKRVTYKDNDIDELMVAWCITVHKYQGSQSPYIVMIIASEQQIMITKELVYTGFTRTAKKLDVFGNINMLRLAPSRSAVKKRYTSVQKIIKGFRYNKECLVELKINKSENN